MKGKPIHKVEHKNLPKHWGWAYLEENKIILNKQLGGYRYLLYALHEHFHLKHPDWSETKVRKESSKTARFLWQLGFRWVDT